MIIEIICLVVFILAFIKLYYWLTKPWQHFRDVPMRNYPLLGHIPGLLKLRKEHFCKHHLQWLEKHHTLLLQIGPGNPYILTKNLNVFETVLSSSKIIKKSASYWVFEDWLGKSLFTSTGNHWRQRRKLLTPSFHFKILTEFLPIVEKHSKIFISSLRRSANQETAFDAFKLMKLYSIGIICETSMGIECNVVDTAFAEQSDLTKEELQELNFVKSIDKLLVLLVERNDTPWYWWKPLFQLFPSGKEYYEILDNIKSFCNDVIEKRTEKLNAEGYANTKQPILLDKLLMHFNTGELTVEDVLSETQTFMFAGYDTIATALSWCLYCLGRNKDKQAIAYDEVKRIKGLGLPLQEALKEMKYIECIVKETMRIHPSAPLFSRDIEEDVIIDSVLYPKSSSIGLCILAMQRDAKYWEEPLKFKPERFLELSGPAAACSPYAFVPFSAGPRNCIGQKFAMMELKTTIYHILLDYQVNALQKEEELLETIDIIHSVANEEGLLIAFAAR